MNIFKKIYCRIYQFAFKIMMPFLPYREPKILNTNDEVCDVLKSFKIKNVLIVTDNGITALGLYNGLVQKLKDYGIGVFVYDKTVANPTTLNVQDGELFYKQNNCEAIIGFGGGSAMDCAKAIGAKIANPKKTLKQMKGVLKVRKKIPLLIAVPTTAGTGSETTLAAVITDSQTRYKYAINDFPLIPKYALLDANLTVGLPKHITSTTGMDALTHAIEAYIGNSTTKKTRQCSLFAIKTIFENILQAYISPQNMNARKNMLIASYNAGLAFTKSYVGYVHAIAHSLGGKYNVSHGLANAIILPHVLNIFGNKIYKKLHQIAVYCGLATKNTPKEHSAKLIINKIEWLNEQMNIPTTVKELKKEHISELAITAEKEANPLYPVPVLFSAKELENIFYKLLN